MKRWELMQIIQAASVSDRAKVVGMCIASHWSPRSDAARLRLDTIGAEVGKSNRAVINAINDLIRAEIFVRIRTGRASILRLGSAAKRKVPTYSGSEHLGRSERIKTAKKPTTGTRFSEFCEPEESTDDSGERYTKDMEFYLGF